MMPIANSLLAGAYTGSIAAVIKASQLDQKIFDFVAPQFSHAFAFGALATMMHLTLSNIIAKVTSTRVETGYVWGYKYEDVESKHPTVYKIGKTLSPVISAFGSAYLLRQMNYTMPYRFIGVCAIPLVLYSLSSSSDE